MKPTARQPLEGQPRAFAAMVDGKLQNNRHQTAEAALTEVEPLLWMMCSIIQLVYSAGSWHNEGVVARYMRGRNGQTFPLMGKFNRTTHTTRSHGGQSK
jgi:hypothetical protein